MIMRTFHPQTTHQLAINLNVYQQSRTVRHRTRFVLADKLFHLHDTIKTFKLPHFYANFLKIICSDTDYIYIMSHHQHGYPWPSLATPPNRPLLPVGLQDYILYWHRAAVCRFDLVVLLLLVHVTGVHRSTSLMSSSLLLQQCPSCLVRLILIVFVMGGRRPYSCYFVGCCLQDLFNIVCSILL